MNTTFSNTTSSSSMSVQGSHRLSPGAEAAVTLAALAILIFGMWAIVVVYKACTNRAHKKNFPVESSSTDNIELGNRRPDAGINAGHGVEGLGMFQHELNATRHEVRKCVCM